MSEHTTDALDKILGSTAPGGFGSYIADNSQHMADRERPFAAYMRRIFREKGLRQQDIFIAADIPERYGYKLISEEKHTRQRDLILRILLAAGFSLHEVQTALKLYGMSPLYSRIPRDAALIIAFNTGMYDPYEVDRFLAENHLDPLRVCGTRE